MSLAKISTFEAAKRQYFFKLNAYTGAFSALILTQLFGLLFSLMGIGNSHFSSDSISINVKVYSGNIIIIFTMIWAIANGITITTKQYRDGDFAFVSNRLSGNLSNIAFLLTTSVLGGITASLLGVVLKAATFFFVGTENAVNQSIIPSPLLLINGILITIFYIALFSALGYIVGTFVQLSKLFIVLFLGAFITALYQSATSGEEGIIINSVKFFIEETSYLFFSIKILITLVLLFILAVFLSNRLEVRK